MHCYPFERLPNTGLSQAPVEGTAEYYSYFNRQNAQCLVDVDKTVLQAMYQWIQTYHMAVRPESRYPCPPSNRPSYSELYWLTQYFQQLRNVVLQAGPSSMINQSHRELFNSHYPVLLVGFDGTDIYNIIVNNERFVNHVINISLVLALNAEFERDLVVLNERYHRPSQALIPQ